MFPIATIQNNKFVTILSVNFDNGSIVTRWIPIPLIYHARHIDTQIMSFRLRDMSFVEIDELLVRLCVALHLVHR